MKLYGRETTGRVTRPDDHTSSLRAGSPRKEAHQAGEGVRKPLCLVRCLVLTTQPGGAMHGTLVGFPDGLVHQDKPPGRASLTQTHWAGHPTIGKPDDVGVGVSLP
jgi:hypothetical protein